jgi:mRNA-degrading endonuclease RelE of RelBE toxin-antitoxin system
MLQIFFTGFGTKRSQKMLRKISRTHRKIFKNFVKKIGQVRVQIAKEQQETCRTGGCV